jgi:hypothetical protein
MSGSSKRFLGPSFKTKILYAFLICSMHSTFPAHLILLVFITVKFVAKSTNYETPRYAVFLICSSFLR